jgi:hypothetical protein
MYDFNEMASRGADLLDAENPTWYRITDLDTLDMSDPDFCVLGQVYGDYCDGLLKLNLTAFGARVRNYGFDMLSGTPDEDFTLLTQAWREQILLRRIMDAIDASENTRRNY